MSVLGVNETKITAKNAFNPDHSGSLTLRPRKTRFPSFIWFLQVSTHFLFLIEARNIRYTPVKWDSQGPEKICST